MTFRKLCATTALMSLAAGAANAYAPQDADEGLGPKVTIKLDSDTKVEYAEKRMPHPVYNVEHEIFAPDGKTVIRVPGIRMGSLTYVLHNPDQRTGQQRGISIPTQDWRQNRWGQWEPVTLDLKNLTGHKPGTAVGDALNALYHTSTLFDAVHNRLKFIRNRIELTGGAIPARLEEVLGNWGTEHITIGTDFMEEMNAFFAMNGPLRNQKELIMCKFMSPETGKIFRTVGDVNVLDHEAGHGVFSLLFPELFGTVEKDPETGAQSFLMNTVVEGGILEGGADIMVLLRMMTDPAILELWENETGGITDVSSFLTRSGEAFANAIGMDVGYFRDAESGKKVLSRREGAMGPFSLDDRHEAKGTGDKVHGIGESLVSPIWDIWEWAFNAHHIVHKDAGVSMFDSAKITAEAVFGNMFFEALFTTDQATSVQEEAKLSRIGTRFQELAAGYSELLGISGLAGADINNDLLKVGGSETVPSFADVIQKHFNAHNIGVGIGAVGADQESEGDRFFTARRGGGVGFHQCDRLEDKIDGANAAYKLRTGNDHPAFFNMKKLKNGLKKAGKAADALQTGLHIGGQIVGGDAGRQMNEWNGHISRGRSAVRAGRDIFGGLFGGYADMAGGNAYGAPVAHPHALRQTRSATRVPVYLSGPADAAFFDWDRARRGVKKARSRVRHGLDRVDHGLDVYGRHGSVFGLPHADHARRAQTELRQTRHQAERAARDAEDFARRTRRAVEHARDGSRSARNFLNGLFGQGYGAPMHRSMPAAPVSVAPQGSVQQGGLGQSMASPRSIELTRSATVPSTCPGGVCPMPTPSAGYPGSHYAMNGQGQAGFVGGLGDAFMTALPVIARDITRPFGW